MSLYLYYRHFLQEISQIFEILEYKNKREDIVPPFEGIIERGRS